MQHASTLDLDQFEDSAFYDKLERARQQTVWPHGGCYRRVLTQVQDIITMTFFSRGFNGVQSPG